MKAVGEDMNKNSMEHFKSCIRDLPKFSVNGNKLIFDEPIQSGIVYEMAFDGNDAEAEMVEKSTDLSFLGNSTTPYSKSKSCVMTGQSTQNRVYLAKTY